MLIYRVHTHTHTQTHTDRHTQTDTHIPLPPNTHYKHVITLSPTPHAPFPSFPLPSSRSPSSVLISAIPAVLGECVGCGARASWRSSSVKETVNAHCTSLSPSSATGTPFKSLWLSKVRGCPETLRSQCCGHMTGALYLKLLKLSIHSLGNTCKRIEVSLVSAKCFLNAIHSALAYICIIPQGSGCRGKVFYSGRLSILIAQ